MEKGKGEGEGGECEGVCVCVWVGWVDGGGSDQCFTCATLSLSM